MTSPVLLISVDPQIEQPQSAPTFPRALHEVTQNYQHAEPKGAETKPQVVKREICEAVENDLFTRDLPVDETVLIPAGVTIKGDITTDGRASVIIGGRVEGTVDAGKCTVVVKDGAEVVGTIRAESSIIIAGNVTASTADDMAVITSGLWILAETGKVRGTTAYGRFRTYEGGTFNGRAIPYSEWSEKS